MSGNLKNEYVFFGGKRMARRDSSGNIFYYFADHLGTSREIVQAGQSSPCYDADFFPFGGERTPIVNSCSTSQNYKFTGKERDSESGLDDFGARYYASQFGRFMSPDWAARPTAVPYAVYGDPQSLNLYGYVRDDPVSRADPDGHCYPWCTVAVGAFVGAITGGGAEIISEKINNPHGAINWSRVEHATEGGAVAGAITGLAGPEAGFAAKAALGATGSVIGGGVERGANGERIVDPKAIAVDAGAGAAGAAIEKGAEKIIPGVDPMKQVGESSGKQVFVLKTEKEVARETTARNVVRTTANGAVETTQDAARRAAETKKKKEQP